MDGYRQIERRTIMGKLKVFKENFETKMDRFYDKTMEKLCNGPEPLQVAIKVLAPHVGVSMETWRSERLAWERDVHKLNGEFYKELVITKSNQESPKSGRYPWGSDEESEQIEEP